MQHSDAADSEPVDPAVPGAHGPLNAEGLDTLRPEKPWPSRWQGLALPTVVAAAGVAAVTLLHFRDPHIEGSYGMCPSYLLFGVYCPGCGGMRAVHNLTDGHIIDSVHSNLLALPLLVLFALWVGDWAIRSWRGQGPRLPAIGYTTMWVLLGSLAVYSVLRNTPWGTWLTPV